MNNDLIVEKTFNAPVSRVWKAITDKNEMKLWYFDVDDFRAEPGFKFRFSGKTEDCVEYIHLCTVTEVIPQKRLTYSWIYEGFEGISYVTFELFDEGEKTRLRLSHAGLESFPPMADFARKNFEAGWNEIIGTNLEKYLEKSVVL